MRLCFTPAAWEDYLWWQQQERRLLKRVNQLIRETLRSSFEGICKPEPLKGNLSGYWSRRISEEHRLVYTVKGDDLVVIACRYHYSE